MLHTTRSSQTVAELDDFGWGGQIYIKFWGAMATLRYTSIHKSGLNIIEINLVVPLVASLSLVPIKYSWAAVV